MDGSFEYLEMSFEEALQRYIQTDPTELGKTEETSIKEDKLDNLMASFEAKVQFNQEGIEFWYARDLQKLFGYLRWETFEQNIKKSQTACQNFGKNINNHFQEVFRGSPKNSEGGRTARDFRLSRYAAYLIAQNSDPRKPAIAFAQTYFAVQTRRQELTDKATENAQNEDQKRLFIRQQIKEHHKSLASAAQQYGVKTGQDFAKFYQKGYQGLYQLSLYDIRKRKNITQKEKVLDHVGSTELAANFFRVTQTEEKLRRDKIVSKEQAFDTHYEVGKQVRDLMLKISGIAPEDLPAAQNIKHIQTHLPKAKTAAEITHQPSKVAIDISRDLWKYALLVMASKPAGIMMTTDLIKELPQYIEAPVNATNTSAMRKESRFPQLVRNLKSNKKNKTNFISQGYVQDIKGGFQITLKGLNFVKEYFKDRIEF